MNQNGEDMKTCIKCGREKTDEEFYAHSDMADGRLNKCKECCCTEARENRAKNLDRVAEYERDRATRPERKKVQLAYQRRYREINREKIRAQRKVAYYVRTGQMTQRPCEVCGSTTNIHAHHDDYSRPLDVTWLCAKHHKERHDEK